MNFILLFDPRFFIHYKLSLTIVSVELLFGVQMTSVYILLLVNCTLCFACVYFANYGSESLFELLLLSESLGKYYSLHYTLLS